MILLWTKSEDVLLRDLCSSGLPISAAQIAQRISAEFQLDPPRTKAAVVSRARRIGVDLPLEPARRIEPQDGPTSSILVRPRPVYRPEGRLPSKRMNIFEEPPGAIGVFLLNAAEGDCRAPIVGTRGLTLRVCGDPVKAASRYCAACHGRMFNRVENVLSYSTITKYF